MKRSNHAFGPWALVTGANSSIGAAFTDELAKQGYNLVLVGRNKAGLATRAKEIEAHHSVATKTVILDLLDHDFLEQLRKKTSNIDIGLLVSNAGDAAMGAVLRVELDQLKKMLQLNTQSHLELVHYFGRRFEARGKGGIVLVSSTAGLQGTPYVANYAGAKSYLLNLGMGLNYEMRGTGVNVTVLLPGPTRTPMLTEKPAIPLSKLPAPVMKPEVVARVGLRALNKNKPFVIAGRMNRIMSNMGMLMGKVRARNMWGGLIKGIVPVELKVR